MGLASGFLIIYLVIPVLRLGVETGGFLRHWLIPGVDLGPAILTGVIPSGIAIPFYGRLTGPIEGTKVLDEEPPPTGWSACACIPSSHSRRSRRRKP